MGLFSRKKKKDDFDDLKLDKDFDMGKGLDDPTSNLGGTGDLSMDFKDDFQTPEMPERELDMGQSGPLPQPGLQHQPLQQQQQQSFHDDHSYKAAKDFEIITTKLDALRSAIESMNQRLVNIERYLHDEKSKRTWRHHSWYL